MAYFKAKLESDGDWSIPLFQAILSRKRRQMFTYTDWTMGFVWTKFD
jgi:hypothetical protein